MKLVPGGAGAGRDQQGLVDRRENITVQQAGDDVHVEQLSTIVEGSGTHVGIVFQLFSAVDRLITGVRGYRNDRGLPAG